MLFLVTEYSNHLAAPDCKKSKWLNGKIIVTQNWYNSIERFVQFHTLLFLVRDAILTGLFLSYFETTQRKNHFDTNLVKIESKWLHTRNILAKSWINFKQWFPNYCHFRVYANFSNSPCWPSWIVNLHKFETVPFKNQNGFIQETFWHKVATIFNQWYLRYCPFRVHAFFSNDPWQPSWIVNLHKYEMVPFRAHCNQI